MGRKSLPASSPADHARQEAVFSLTTHYPVNTSKSSPRFNPPASYRLPRESHKCPTPLMMMFYEPARISWISLITKQNSANHANLILPCGIFCRWAWPIKTI